MSLEKEKIVSNTKKYFETLTKIGVDTEKLTTFLGIELATAPAFATNNMPNVFEGGLIDFTLNVTKHLIELNTLLPEIKRINKDSLIKVGLLHSIGKAKLYTTNVPEWKAKKGVLYEYNNALASMRIGQRSLYYSMSNGIVLTEEEAQAIVFSDINDDDMVKGFSSNLSKLLKLAIELTIIEKQ